MDHCSSSEPFDDIVESGGDFPLTSPMASLTPAPPDRTGPDVFLTLRRADFASVRGV
jgi:hypothetical protein